MKSTHKHLAAALCALPLALAGTAYAQTGGTPEGTTSSQSGSHTSEGSHSATGAQGATGARKAAPSAASPASGASSSAATPSSSPRATASAASGHSYKDMLQGKNVYNENDDKIGSINDVILSADGKATHLVVGVGGFVGMGEHDVAIPFSEIQGNGDKLMLKGYTKDQLKDMPAYEYPKAMSKSAPTPASSASAPAPSPMGPR